MSTSDRLRQRRRRDRGAAAVETALVLPILLMLVFGIIDFGRMLNTQIKLTEAAREGARVLSLDNPSVPGDGVDTRVDKIMGGTTAVITRETTCASNTDATVRVTHRFSFITPVGALAGGFGGDFDLRATGVMPCHG